MSSHNEIPTQQEVEEAYKRIKPYISNTPIMTNGFINGICNCEAYFKCENLQKTGSFKVRGAANKILQLKQPKVLTAFSSGNHAQAVSYIGHQLGFRSYIVMPSVTSQVKKNAVKSYHAEIIESGPTAKQQVDLCEKVAKEKNAVLIHPFNDIEIITGAASVGYEIYQECQDFDYIVVPIGGGGLSSGTILATQYYSPKTVVIGVQPYLARDAKDSLKSGKIEPEYPPLTLAEGVRVNIGTVTFQILKKYLKEVILVSEEEMIEAAKIFLERMKIVVQISGALVLAAVIKDDRFRNKKVCAIISGGNMDLSPYFNVLKANL